MGEIVLSPPGILALALAGSGVLLLLLAKPRLALMACFPLVLIASTRFRVRDPHALLTGDVDTAIIFELALYGFVFAAVLRNAVRLPAQYWSVNLVELLLLGYALLILASATWSPTFNITAVRAIQIGILVALSYVAARILTPQRTLEILLVSVLAYVFLFAVAAFIVPGGNGFRSLERGRFTWFGVHPIIAGTYAGSAAVLLAAAGLFAASPKFHAARRLLKFLGPPLILILIATHSRGPLFAFAMALVVLLSASHMLRQHADRLKGAILISSTLALLLSWMMWIDTAPPGQSPQDESKVLRYILRGQTTEQFASGTGRMDLWRLAIEVAAEQPVIGHGYLASRSVFLERFPWAGTAHNGFFDALLNVGILGVVLLFTPVLLTLVWSLIATLRLQSGNLPHHAIVLGGVTFLIFNSVTTESFGGMPGYEPLLLFTLAVAHSRLGLSRRVGTLNKCSSGAGFIGSESPRIGAVS